MTKEPSNRHRRRLISLGRKKDNVSVCCKTCVVPFPLPLFSICFLVLNPELEKEKKKEGVLIGTCAVERYCNVPVAVTRLLPTGRYSNGALQCTPCETARETHAFGHMAI